MDLNSLQKSLKMLAEYPIEKWQPPFCGELPMFIDRDGQWFYQQSPIQRIELVRLFAAVLSQQQGVHYLTTPAEKVAIKVADAAYLLTQALWVESEQGPVLQLMSSLGQSYAVTASCPIVLQAEPSSGQMLPYLQLPRGLRAKFSRNLYYQLVEQALATHDSSQTVLQLQSGDYVFSFGLLTE